MPALTQEEFLKRAKTIHSSKYDYSQAEYVRADAKVKIICKEHGLFEQRASDHTYNKAGCPRCSAPFWKLTIPEMETLCPDMVRGQQHTGSSRTEKYLFYCGEHGNYLQTFDQHIRGHGCYKCGRERLTIEEAERRYPLMVKGQTWKGVHAKYFFMCEEHGRYEQRYRYEQRHSRVPQGTGCPECRYQNWGKHLLLNMSDVEKKWTDIVPGQEWKGANEKYWFRCLKGKHANYKQKYDSHNSGAACPICRESRAERTIRLYLADRGLGDYFEQQKRFETCRYKKRLPFDFGSEHFKVLIEFHGEQHFRLGIFNGYRITKKDFAISKKRDSLKVRWARRNGYKLVVVTYRIKNIASYLDKRLTAHGVLQPALVKSKTSF